MTSHLRTDAPTMTRTGAVFLLHVHGYVRWAPECADIQNTLMRWDLPQEHRGCKSQMRE